MSSTGLLLYGTPWKREKMMQLVEFHEENMGVEQKLSERW
jgi:hypothetical protein